MSKKSSAAGKGRGPQRAREEAARRLAAKRRAEQRQRAIWVAAIVLVVVIAGGLISYIVYHQHQPKATGPNPTIATASLGIPIGKASAPVTMDLWGDFQCPACDQFEKSTGATINKLVAQGKIREVFHPVAILDRESDTQYSTRSSAASACVAEYGGATAYEKFITLLYDNQPAEGAHGLPNSQLISYGTQAGVNNAKFADCVNNQTYAGWTAKVTTAFTKNGLSSTPTVLLNGSQLDRNSYTPQGLTAQVEKLSAASK